jgi:ABC-type transporter Mla subunit MlaD
MSRERRIGLGILAGGALIAVFVGGILLAHEARSLKYTIIFQNAKDLKPGDRVQLSGVDIGVVQYVQLHAQPTRIDIRVKIAPEHADKVRADATAIIGSTAFPNVSGQKVVEIINSETDRPYPPMPKDAMVKGMHNALELGAWKLKKAFEGSKETWRRRLDLMQDNLRRGMGEIERFHSSPRVKETLGQLRAFLERMRKEGRQAVDSLTKEWGPLKAKLQPILKELGDFGRQYLADQIRQIMQQIEETLDRWRKTASGGEATPAAPPAPAATPTSKPTV